MPLNYVFFVLPCINFFRHNYMNYFQKLKTKHNQKVHERFKKNQEYILPLHEPKPCQQETSCVHQGLPEPDLPTK